MTKCPTCGHQCSPKNPLAALGIDSEDACASLLTADGGKHLAGLASHHPAAIVRALAQALIAKGGPDTRAEATEPEERGTIEVPKWPGMGIEGPRSEPEFLVVTVNFALEHGATKTMEMMRKRLALLEADNIGRAYFERIKNRPIYSGEIAP